MTFNEIKELLELFDKSALSKLEIEEDGNRVCMEKNQLVTTAITTQIEAPKEQIIHEKVTQEPKEIKKSTQDNLITIKAPMIGTFYRSPAPNAAPYVKVGDIVKKGQVLAIIEAMKIMNEIEAEFDCKIIDIIPEDGQPIEFDAPLFLVERV